MAVVHRCGSDGCQKPPRIAALERRDGRWSSRVLARSASGSQAFAVVLHHGRGIVAFGRPDWTSYTRSEAADRS